MVDSPTLARAGLAPIGRDRVLLANGSLDAVPVCVVAELCVGPLCAANMRVLAGPPGIEGLLGTDFLKAAEARVTIADGVLTLSRK
jgi:hypothetical protein